MKNSIKYSRSFLEENDVVFLAKELLGARIETNFNNCKTTGIIVETEAYRAPEDKASHAFDLKRTARNDIMYSRGGMAYVYLCYGIHHLFNIVTGPENTPHAVLIRAIRPDSGLDHMRARRNIKSDKQLTNGPGKWTAAFRITTAYSGIDLLDELSPISIKPSKLAVTDKKIISTPRIGIDYAQEWVDKPWRFLLKENT